jgi:hypothetical protein
MTEVEECHMYVLPTLEFTDGFFISGKSVFAWVNVMRWGFMFIL